ncbi:MAG: CDP-alcohol phosphatidyltransferase family protein [Aestuariivirgaceae bacterium]|nr:CDP-alcohol phosphatidyltransferase family protein [Aestuariivirgaceae bacterium]
MNLPNLITLLRILLVPLIIWLIIAGQFWLAFVFFIVAGISDGVEGYIAKHFQLTTELGAYLDPIADKLLLVSIYLSLGLLQYIPAWLVILVATRDVLIVGAVLLARVLDRPVVVQPLMISKINTTGQILLAGVVLGALGFGFADHDLLQIGYFAVGALTIASGGAYLRSWIAHMANGSH